MNPRDYNVPEHYQHWAGDPAEDRIGPFFFRMEGEVVCSAFRIQAHHCNSHASAHGGLLMAFADYTLCIAANQGSHESVVTVSCSNEFIAPALEGDLVCGRTQISRRGGSLVFVRAELSVENRIILTSSGVIKRLRSKH